MSDSCMIKTEMTNYAERLLSQYTFDIAPGTSNQNLMCIKCKNLLNNAYQTYCGCQYCHACIFDHLSEGEIHCCGGKEICNDEPLTIDVNVLKNAMLNRKVLRAKVICPYESCTHIAVFEQMEDHMRMCTKQSIECPYLSLGCNTAMVTKDTIQTHLDNETLPHTQLLIVLIKNLKKEVGALKDSNKTEIERIRKECAEKEGRISILEEESGNAKIQIRELVEELAIMKKENKDLRKEPRSNENLAEDEPKERVIEARPKISRSQSTTRCMNDTETKCPEIDRQVDIEINRPVDFNNMQFTINKFGERKMAKEVIYSPYFYSHTSGYKIRLKVYPGGNGSAIGTHLSLYFIIGKGEYDDQLPWTFKYSFDISIINLSNGDTLYSRSYIYPEINYKGAAFNKPIDKDNNGYGFPKFIATKDLENIMGQKDFVTIKCTIMAPQ